MTPSDKKRLDELRERYKNIPRFGDDQMLYLLDLVARLEKEVEFEKNINAVAHGNENARLRDALAQMEAWKNEEEHHRRALEKELAALKGF